MSEFASESPTTAGPRSHGGSGMSGQLVAPAAIARAVLLGRAVVTVTAAAAGLLLIDERWRVPAVVALVVAATVAQVAVLTRRPGALVRHPWPALLADLLVAGGVLALSRGGMAFFCYSAGAAALAGALIGMRALPLWALHAALGFASAAVLLRQSRPSPEVTAFVAAFPVLGLLAGVGATVATAALVRYVELTVAVVASAQRSAAASERARLARELHDSVAKTLRGVSFAAVALPQSLRRHPALAEQLADTVSRGAEAAAREARELMEGLRADDPGEDFGYGVARACRDWERRTGIPVRTSIDDVDPPLETRYELLRILREGLANVERHARAARVWVRVAAMPGEVELSVADDGVGFAAASLDDLRAAGRLGLVGVHERASGVGGAAEVRSAPGEGSLLRVRVPVPAGAAA
ncbi:sensor histidine kinase [Catenuloplanes atrovinosus]|uniref:histidine kinase n=1 Tax=Catenuloplanes atrovinosus TaxID=137266 RepID=A0AAE3YKY0_9ACTN|nr:histidine kinase [Catenuloplanes atrovinosus]MDR7274098.1 signal transduction histidine kinase [Catenuloplanes atrovinosus]